MTLLFDVNKARMTRHINNIYIEGKFDNRIGDK